MNLLTFLRRRFVQMIPVLLGISLITFFMIHLIPGDPARNMLGPRATPERVAELRQSLGLDEPLWSQYRRFLTGVVRGDLGTSLYYRQAVGPLVLERLPPTVFLIVYSAVIALIVAIPLGIVAAVRRNTWIDQVIRTVSLDHAGHARLLARRPLHPLFRAVSRLVSSRWLRRNVSRTSASPVSPLIDDRSRHGADPHPKPAQQHGRQSARAIRDDRPRQRAD